MTLFIPITKVDVAKRLVYGTLTEEIPDKTGEILDYNTAKPAFQIWSEQFQHASGGKSYGNVRAMHGGIAAGKFTDIDFDDDNKRISGVAKIVDDEEWNKVLEGVYTGFSIGGGYARRWQDTENPALMRYTPILTEVSLVDNPAVPTATFDVIKSDGSVECRKFTLQSLHNNEEEPIVDDNQDIETAQDDHYYTLLEELAWLKEDVLDTEDENAILPHIIALQQYLSGEDCDNEDVIKKYINFERNVLQTVLTLQKRIDDLEAMPLPAKGSLRAMRKQEDRFNDNSDIAVSQEKSTTPHELMKIALSRPVAL